ncbi:MAG: M4 family metallopeptidase [Crocinitomicaceae bacterium]
MKNPITLLIAVLVCSQGYSQAPPLPTTICKEFRPAGWIYFHDASINAGELFTDHKPCFFTQVEDSMCMDRTWTDDWLGFDHFHYQQKYMGIEVEGCEFIEHAKPGGNLVYANGKICPDIYTKYHNKAINKQLAFLAVVNYYEVNTWSWQDPGLEAQYKIDMGDPSATSKPEGELVFTTNNWQVPKGYIMDANDYRLAYRFTIMAIDPYFYKTVYVDALTGDVFKEVSLDCHDGPANIPFYGAVTLDTRWEGWPTNAHVLHTNDAGRDVHTKYDGGWSWGLTGEVEDADGDWGTSNQGATAVHWAVTQTWDYFKNVHGRDGLDDNGGKVRVFAETDDNPGAWYHQLGGIDRIFAGFYSDDGVYSGELTVMAHEFTHGVDQREGKLFQVNEPGALDESFADIFGFLTRRYVNGSTSWEIGVPTTVPRNRRNLQYPNSLGFHYDYTYSGGVIVSVSEMPGMPDTYEGDWWHPWQDSGNDQGGVHINNGIQNKWFFLLSMGETGVNDLGDAYVINGIGIDKAAAITYYNLVNNMEKESTFEDAKEGAIAAALLYYGECSFEHIETQNAWYAVGVGTASTCIGAGMDENEMAFSMYPNPAQDETTLQFNYEGAKTINVYASNGQLLKSIDGVTGSKYVLDVSYLAKGSYFINVVGSESKTTVLIKY